MATTTEYGQPDARYFIGDHVIVRTDDAEVRGIVCDDPDPLGRYTIRVLTGQILATADELRPEPADEPETTIGQIWINDDDGETFVVTHPADGFAADGMSCLWLADTTGDGDRLLPLPWGESYGTRHQLDGAGWRLFDGVGAPALTPGEQVISVLGESGVCLSLLDEEPEPERTVERTQAGLGVTTVWFTDGTFVEYGDELRLVVFDGGDSDGDEPTGWGALLEAIGA